MSKRDEGLPNVFYLVVFRHQQSGAQNQKCMQSISNLMSFIETQQDYEERGLSRPNGYDIYYVDLEALEIGLYDAKDLKNLMRLPKGRR